MMRSIQKFFTSLKIAAILLFILGFISIIGTVIPQGSEITEYLRIYPRWGTTILALGWDDLYHGWLFITLLVLISISAVVCTWTRFKMTKKKIFQRLALATAGEIQSLSVKLSIPKSKVAEVSQQKWETKTLEDGSKLHFSVSGQSALWGALMIHIGLVAILAGGLIDSQLGVETMIRGIEGEAVPIPPLDGLRAASKADRLGRQIRGMRSFNAQDPRIPTLNVEFARLASLYDQSVASSPLKMLFEKLEIDFHETDQPQEMESIKNWKSTVSVLRNGARMDGGVIKVNQPLHFEDYSFFQTDWQKKYKELIIKVIPLDGSGSAALATQSFKLVASLVSPVKPDWSPYTFVVHQFYPDFRMAEGGFTSVSDEFNNPAAQIEAIDSNQKVVGRAWAFSEAMSAVAGHNSSIPFKFVIEGANPSFQSGLQITSYPGAPIVWIGCFIFSLGMALTFYIGYYETWFLEKADGKGVLAITGNRHPIVLKRHLDDFTQRFNLENPS